MKMSQGTGLMLGAMLWASLAGAQEKPDPKKAFTDAKEAGIEYQLQGEYVGEVDTQDGKQKLGAQIIAQGGGKFLAVVFVGGLPGDGWKRGDKSEKASGELKDNRVELTHEKGSATIQDGVMAVRNSDGNEFGQLKKVERKSPTLGMKPPEGAVVLFDGTSADAFEGGKLTEDGLLNNGVTSKELFQSCTIHLEFRTPFQPFATGQGRGNSGCYVQGRYEVQVLDSFGLDGKNNESGGIYEISEPSVNMCFPPLAWQTYDIDYTAAQYDGDKKVKNATITVRHNGVTVQQDVELPRTTRASKVKEGPEPGPIYLQNHGNPVNYRNIWVLKK